MTRLGALRMLAAAALLALGPGCVDFDGLSTNYCRNRSDGFCQSRSVTGPSSIGFGEVVYGATATATATISNGSADAPTGALSVELVPATGPFSVSTVGSTCDGPLSPAGSCTLALIYSPRSNADEGELRITPASGEALHVHLSGGGVDQVSFSVVGAGELSIDDGGVQLSASGVVQLPRGAHAVVARPLAGNHLFSWGGACAAPVNGVCALAVSGPTDVSVRFFPHNYAFVTSQTIAPTWADGRAGADAFCQAVAVDAGVPGHFLALMASPGDPVDTRFAAAGARGWIRVDGAPAFDDLGSYLLLGRQFAPLNVDERGATISSAPFEVATGIDSVGFGQPSPRTCGGWTDALSDAGYRYGRLDGAGQPFLRWNRDWNDAPRPCDVPSHLYCFATDDGTPLASTADPQAKLAFRSEVIPLGAGSDGGFTYAGARAECNAEAAAAGLSGQFLPLLARSTVPASAPFDASSRWYRPDGTLVAVGGLRAGSDRLLASVSQLADGSYAVRDTDVMVGGRPSVTSTTTCSDWEDGAANPDARTGSLLALEFAFDDHTLEFQDCNIPHPIYCFQQ